MQSEAYCEMNRIGDALTGINRVRARAGLNPIPSSISQTDLRKAIIHQQEVLVQSSYTYLSIFRKDAAGNWQFSHSVPNFMQPIRHIEIDQQGCIWASHFYKGMFCLHLSPDLKTAEKGRILSVAR